MAVDGLPPGEPRPEFRPEPFMVRAQPRDQPWLWREAYLRDPAGNLICLYHAGENRRNPPWRIDGRG